MIARVIKLVSETSVWILVQELAAKTLNATFIIIFQFAPAFKAILEMHSYCVHRFLCQYLKIHAVLLHVVQIASKCIDPCPGTCGISAKCQVVNHNPICSCPPRYTGDPFIRCNVIPIEETPPTPINPCQPSPCGSNAQCKEINGSPSCSCLPEFIGSPPNCRPECSSNTECASHLACINNKCKDPCPGTCGSNAECRVISHTPNCSMFHLVYHLLVELMLNVEYKTKLVLALVFLNTLEILMKVVDLNAFSVPIQSKMTLLKIHANLVHVDPTVNVVKLMIRQSAPVYLITSVVLQAAGQNVLLAQNVHKTKHALTKNVPILALELVVLMLNVNCTSGYTGDPFTRCYPIPHGYTGDPFSYCQLKPQEVEPLVVDPCNPTPCGSNARCDNGICTCLPEYQGDPYRGCRPECVLSMDCPKDKACIRNKCKDPCPGTCGQNAECSVANHIPICTCTQGYIGNAFVLCNPIPAPVIVNPCNPSPCGPNSQCRAINGQSVCSCVPGFIGSPPTCRPECVTSAECPLNEACVNQKCIDPCPGTCGLNAKCQVVNHNPICSCPPQYTGDPFLKKNPFLLIHVNLHLVVLIHNVKRSITHHHALVCQNS
ncbi:hypothetical protein BDFB_000151 [Asbolus verrucosus]|uniref:EGF-like domain-containing protein n=1 Tax=Asbolus verrucosus TaxID=1661398 RepID=A0A482VUL5_ASBVE|nr:hypothetical protein BDFB_000151 [Asbolus verrucosus]